MDDDIRLLSGGEGDDVLDENGDENAKILMEVEESVDSSLLKGFNSDKIDNIGKHDECIDPNGNMETQNMTVVTNLFYNSKPTNIFDSFKDKICSK